MWAVDDGGTNENTSMSYDNMKDEFGRLDHTRAAFRYLYTGFVSLGLRSVRAKMREPVQRFWEISGRHIYRLIDQIDVRLARIKPYP